MDDTELQTQLIERFAELITSTLGLCVRPQMHHSLWQKIMTRVHALKLTSPQGYYHLLVSQNHRALEDPEWRELISLLSITESYFFRDQGQFLLLRNRLLPELMQRKRSPDLLPRSLRIWSAGCSTGEEAYSLAMLLRELVPSQEDWKMTIIGTDINRASLAYAQRGIYSNWSFRLVAPEIKQKYFRPHRQGWEIDPVIRNMVQFQAQNLVREHTAEVLEWPELQSVDLILCRNVFIYFSRTAIAQVLKTFYDALVPGGYLLTGHAELHGQSYYPFTLQALPESVVYKRELYPCLMPDPPVCQPLFPPTIAPLRSIQDIRPPKIQTSKSEPASQEFRENLERVKAQLKIHQVHSSNQSSKSDENLQALSEITRLIDSKAYEQAITKARQLIVQNNAQQLRIYCLLAEVYANLGDYANAIDACQQAFQRDPFAIAPLYLLAQIAQEQGDLEAAKGLLKRVIYLDPVAGYAYFELGCLYEQQGNLIKAQRNWRSALSVLKQLPNQAMVDWCKGVTVAELQMVIEQKLIGQITA